MEILAAHGTEEQKQRWLYPLMNQEIWSAYSMTEPEGGSDPNLFKTHAVRDGDEWVINGEKWFTSAGRAADILFVMCTNGMFIVPTDTPGVEFQPDGPGRTATSSTTRCACRSTTCSAREDGAKVLAQRRLGGGRIHHCMRTIAQLQAGVRHDVRAGADPAVARQGDRRAPDGAGGDRRLLRRDQHAAAAWCCGPRGRSTTRAPRRHAPRSRRASTPRAKTLREVSYRAIHIFGSLGVTNLTPLLDDVDRARRTWPSWTASTRSTR